MKIVKILDDKYNNFLNSLTAEQLSMLYNDNENISNSEYMLCRVLSLDEYDKYIKVNTLSDAIEANNQNVWNYFLLTKNHGFGATNDGRSTEWNYWDGYGVPVEWRPENLGWEGIAYANNQTKSYIFPIISEICSNNNSENAIHYGENKHKCIVFASVESIGAQANWKIFDLTVGTCKKNEPKPIGIVSKAYIRRNSSWSECIVNVQFNGSFRPVFQYKDNNKSNNIYY